MARIELKHLAKSFRRERGQPVPAVVDLDLTVEAGEFLVLIGPSGSGKTTTLRLVAGLEEASAGSVFFDGALMNHWPAHERDVAMVFQRDALYPHMTVYENLSFGLELRKEQNIDRRVHEVAELLGVEPFLDRLPRELSGGQRQRVAVGRAIVRRPAVFLFDEPFTNLDAPLRGQLRREIALLQRRLKVTTLYVTHDQAEAMVLGDRIAVLHQGRLQQVATPMELYAHPVNTLVAGMFGAPPMNLVRVLVAQGASGVALSSAAHALGAHRNGLELAEPARINLSGRAGREVMLGVRPEDVAVEVVRAGDGRWPGTVEWVEWLGAEMVVRLIVEGQSIVARLTAAMPFKVGTAVSIRLDPTKLHFFDAVTGQAIVCVNHDLSH
jgi:multiple sugar transport system ATP-binding protein